MSNNRPKLELQLNQPIKLKLLSDLPLVGENGHGKYTMYAVENESGEELVWFAPSTARDVIQSQQLRAGSEIIAKLTGKNKVEVSILGKAADPEHVSKSADNLAEILKQSIADAVQAIRRSDHFLTFPSRVKTSGLRLSPSLYKEQRMRDTEKQPSEGCFF